MTRDETFRRSDGDPLLAVLRFIVMEVIGVLCFAAFMLLVATPFVLIFQDAVLKEIADATTGSQPIVALVLLMLGAAALCGIAIRFFYLLMKITDTVRDGDPFIPENARRLTLMGWTAIAGHLWAFALAIPGLWFASSLKDRGETVDVDASFGGGGVILILVLFVLARVFRHGAAMREDLEGTV